MRRALIVPVLATLVAAGCSSGGGGAGPGSTPPTLPPSTGAELPPSPGLVAAVGGDDAVQLRLRPAPPGVSVGVFASFSPVGLFATAPVTTDPVGPSIVVAQPAGVRFVGLATRADAADPWTPAGPVLEALVAPPIYVDPTAAPGGNGSSPLAAFNDPVVAVVLSAATGGNVWLREGDYGAVSLPTFDGIYIAGGFGASFDLAARDPETQPSIVRGLSGEAIVNVNGARVVLDGLTLLGDGVASVGVDSSSTTLDLRSVAIRDCASRGLRLRAPLAGDPIAVTVTGCEFVDNGGDGLSALGVLDLDVFASRFERNVQEGLDLDDLIAPSGGEARLSVAASVFESNGSEGLDVDLAAGSGGVGAGGTFDVSIRDSLFATNLLTGLLVDIDFETASAWELDLEVVGVVARGNRGAGARFDLDSTASTFVHRCAFTGNAGDGLTVSSETAAGLSVVSTSAFVGNVGTGLRATFGNVPILASHCVLAGNGGGGFRSEKVTSTAAATLAWLQPSPYFGVSNIGSATAADGDLTNVAQAYLLATGVDGDALAVSSTVGLAAGVDVEVAGDDVARVAITVGGGSVSLDPAPGFVAAPTRVAVFGVATGVVEDHRLEPGATVIGDGMVAPGATAVDPGPHGAPDGGEPGYVGPLGVDAFRLARVQPAPIGPLAADALVRLELDRAVLGATVDGSTVRVTDAAGATLSAAIGVVAGAIEITAPPEGWPGVVHVALDRALAAFDGEPLTAPVRVTFD